MIICFSLFIAIHWEISFFFFSVSGLIKLADTVDREAVTHYWLTVYATDLGTVPLVAWTEVYIEVLDINDNSPELSQPIYFASIQENLPKDKFVLKVAATDVDKSSEGKITFHIPDSQRTYFNINSKTGTGWLYKLFHFYSWTI